MKKEYSVLEYEIRKVKRCSDSIPFVKKLLNGEVGASYVAGTLCIGVKDCVTGRSFTTLNVHDINECNFDIQKELQYLTSKCYVKFKSPTHYFYEQALKNIETYEAMKNANAA